MNILCNMPKGLLSSNELDGNIKTGRIIALSKWAQWSHMRLTAEKFSGWTKNDVAKGMLEGLQVWEKLDIAICWP